MERKRFVDYGEPESAAPVQKEVKQGKIVESVNKADVVETFEEVAVTNKKPAKKEAVSAAPPQKKPEAVAKKADSDDDDDWGPPKPKNAAVAAGVGVAAAGTAAALASVAAKAPEEVKKEKTDSDYSADWGDNDLEDKSDPKQSKPTPVSIPQKTEAPSAAQFY